MLYSNLNHLISEITESMTVYEKNIKLQEEIVQVHRVFSTVEYYPIRKLLILHAYLSDLFLEHKFIEDKDILNLSEEKSTLSGRIHTQLLIIKSLLNLPEDIPSKISGSYLKILNVYGYKTSQEKGRLFGHFNCMPRISRECHYYLFKSLYYDFDLKNAHPTILYSYGQNNCLETPTLKRYIENRETFLSEVMKAEIITRNDAKIEVLRCLNSVTDVHVHNYLQPFHKDILLIREHLFTHNLGEKTTVLGEYTMTRKDVKEKSLEKQKVSLQFHYCATEESRSLKVLYEVCLKKGVLSREAVLDSQTRSISFIPFNDGAYIKFPDLKGRFEVDQILKDTNKLIYPYSFELKDIEEN
jgi:hypothetical protein